MMEMGFPKEWCEVALRRCGNSLEQAVNFCFEHGGDMDQILAEEQAIAAAVHAATARGGPGAARTAESVRRSLESTILMKQLLEMGFPPNWCAKALAANRNNVDAALTWILSNGETLAAEDHEEEENAASAAAEREAAAAAAAASGADDADSASAAGGAAAAASAPGDDGDGESDDELDDAKAPAGGAADGDDPDGPGDGGPDGGGDGGGGAAGDAAEPPKVPNPLRVVSGLASILEADGAPSPDAADAPLLAPGASPGGASRARSASLSMRGGLIVEGVAGGGFASVGARGCIATRGKVYFEVCLHTAGCMQIGWCDAAYRGNAENGDGVGDGAHSWAYDGWRQYKWHDGHVEWGARWAEGDIVGVWADLDGDDDEANDDEADAGATATAGGAARRSRRIGFTLNGRAEEVNMGRAFARVRCAGGLYPCASFNRRVASRPSPT